MAEFTAMATHERWYNTSNKLTIHVFDANTSVDVP